VFPAGRGDGPLVNIRKPLLAICELAGLADVTPHVLRHSYATVAHELGYSELTIAGLLGHRAGSVTARYAHHVDSALATAADRISDTIAARLRSGIVELAKNESA
jgi:integrase